MNIFSVCKPGSFYRGFPWGNKLYGTNSVVTGSLSGGGGVARCIGKVHYGLFENGEFIWFLSGKTRRMSQELVVWVCKYFMLHVA